MSELAAKLARRRQLNGEASSGDAASSSAPAAVSVAPVPTAPIKVKEPKPQVVAPVTSTTAARPELKASPPQPLAAVQAESVNIFSLASRENKAVMGHLKSEPSAPVHLPPMHHLHHAALAPAPAPSRSPPAEAAPEQQRQPPPQGDEPEQQEAPEASAEPDGVDQPPAPPSGPEPVPKQAVAVAAAPVLPPDVTDLDDLAGFEGFLDSLDASDLVMKTALSSEGSGAARRTSTKRGGLFADDGDLDEGLASAGSGGFGLSGSGGLVQPGDGLHGDEDDARTALLLQDSTDKKQKRRSRFGNHDLLSDFGFGDEEIGDALMELSLPESAAPLDAAASVDSSAADISALFSHSAGRIDTSNLTPSLGGYSALLSSNRDYGEAQSAPTVDSVKAAHSKLNNYGLFGDDDPSGAAGGSGADSSQAAAGIRPKHGSSSSGNLFKDDVNFHQQVRKKPGDSAEEDSSMRWNERKSMSYEDFLVIMQLPECQPMWNAVERFLFSVLGDGDGELDQKKNLFEKVSKLETFQGTRNLDTRCQNFFDDMMDYYSKHAMFKDCHEDLHMSMRDCLERHVMSKIWSVAMKYVEDKEEDERLLNRMELLSFITPEELDVRPGLRNDIIWELAASELRKMNSYYLPADKIACVVRCAAILFRSLHLTRAKGDDNAAGADDFLPVFIYVVMHSNVQRLHTNCEYIQQFHNPAHLMSKAGYCFVNLRSAMEFILSADSSSVSMDPAEFDARFAEAQQRIDARASAAAQSPSARSLKCTEETQVVYAGEPNSGGLGAPDSPVPTLADISPSVDAPVVIVLETVVQKGPLGIGLDLSAAPDSGRAVVRRFKSMPPGVVNPAMQCAPSIQPGDVIVAVNDCACGVLSEVVTGIKSSGEHVKLRLQRNSNNGGSS